MDEATAQEFARLQAGLGAGTGSLTSPMRTSSTFSLCCRRTASRSHCSRTTAPASGLVEHRYLVVFLLLHRVPHCEMVFLCSQVHRTRRSSPTTTRSPPVMGGRLALSRFRSIVVDDGTSRSVSAELLDQPRAARGAPRLRSRAAGVHPALECHRPRGERRAPARRTPPRNLAGALAPRASKSSGRRIMAEAGVPVPFGREGGRAVGARGDHCTGRDPARTPERGRCRRQSSMTAVPATEMS